MRSKLFFLALLVALPVPTFAKDSSQDPTPPVMRVEGERLIYDTFNLPDELAEISDEHVEPFLSILRKHEGLKTLELNSSGGSLWASKEIARFVLDYGLNTVVSGECSSACVDILLAGKQRTMKVGGKVGFHQRHWDPKHVQEYYDHWRESSSWDTPFDFAAWLYKDTQIEVHENLAYMLSRGVTAHFAIKSIKPASNGMWYPPRQELAEAGILSDAR